MGKGLLNGHLAGYRGCSFLLKRTTARDRRVWRNFAQFLETRRSYLLNPCVSCANRGIIEWDDVKHIAAQVSELDGESTRDRLLWRENKLERVQRSQRVWGSPTHPPDVTRIEEMVKTYLSAGVEYAEKSKRGGTHLCHKGSWGRLTSRRAVPHWMSMWSAWASGSFHPDGQVAFRIAFADEGCHGRHSGRAKVCPL